MVYFIGFKVFLIKIITFKEIISSHVKSGIIEGLCKRVQNILDHIYVCLNINNSIVCLVFSEVTKIRYKDIFLMFYIEHFYVIENILVNRYIIRFFKQVIFVAI